MKQDEIVKVISDFERLKKSSKKYREILTHIEARIDYYSLYLPASKDSDTPDDVRYKEWEKSSLVILELKALANLLESK